jgi:2-dehydropantoate 2-reductase
MRILIFGTGGIGGYFGARLQAVGEDVVFAARGAMAAALAETGLQVRSPRGDLHLKRVALLDAETAGPFDAVLVCTKMGALDAAAAAIRPLIGPGTAVVPLQNGVESVARLRAALGPDLAESVLGGVAYVSAHIAEPGVVQHNTQHARIVFGETDGRHSARAVALRNALEAAGLDTVLTDDVERALWEKFVSLAPLAGACGYWRRDVGAVRADPESRAMLDALAGECIAVGRARGVAMPDDTETTVIARFDELGGAVKPSMLVDLERGKPLELDWLTGATVRLGAEAGVDTPVSRQVYQALKPVAEGAA